MERLPNPIYFTYPYFREPAENIKHLEGDWMKPSIHQHFLIKVEPAGNGFKQKTFPPIKAFSAVLCLSFDAKMPSPSKKIPPKNQQLLQSPCLSR